ncbi:hypothetical protein H8959_003716 [Pygathrix nigripes]
MVDYVHCGSLRHKKSRAEEPQRPLKSEWTVKSLLFLGSLRKQSCPWRNAQSSWCRCWVWGPSCLQELSRDVSCPVPRDCETPGMLESPR